MKTKGIMLLVASLLLVVNLGLRADDEGDAEGHWRRLRPQAQKMRGGPEGRGGAGQIMEGLGLSEQQRDMMKTVHEDYRDQIKALGEKASAAKDALDDAVEADDVDETTIRELSKAAADANADLLVLRGKMKKELSSVLTPEQKELVGEKRAEFKQKRQARRDEMKKRMEEQREKMKQRQEGAKGERGEDGDKPAGRRKGKQVVED